jgi:hypothetical protein
MLSEELTCGLFKKRVTQVKYRQAPTIIQITTALTRESIRDFCASVKVKNNLWRSLLQKVDLCLCEYD